MKCLVWCNVREWLCEFENALLTSAQMMAEANFAAVSILKRSSFAKRGIFVFVYIQSLVFLM